MTGAICGVWVGWLRGGWIPSRDVQEARVMDGAKVGLSAERLKAQLHGMVDELAEQIMGSVNDARLGSIIDDSEEPVRQAGREFVRAAFEAAVQHRIDALEASFPASADDGGRSGDEAAADQAVGEQGAAGADGADGRRADQAGAAVVQRGRDGQRGAG